MMSHSSGETGLHMKDEIDVGLRIKQRRQALKLSLRELARRADVTASFLSQVERGLSNTSIDSLRRIAEGLDVPISYFLSTGRRDPETNACPSSTVVVRAEYRPRLSLSNSKVTYELLTPDLDCTMEVIRGRLAPGTGNVARKLKEPTEECIYVLSGSLLIGVGEAEYVLHPGDSIYFDGPGLNKLACASDYEDAIWISVITPPVF